MYIQKSFKVIVCTLVVFLCHSFNVRAQESGWYAGGGAGIGLTGIDEDFWTDSSVTTSDLKKWNPSYQLFGGYQLHRNFALELGYLRLANTVFTGVSNGESSIWVEGSISGRTEIEGVSIQGVGFWPLSESNVVLYLKGGLFMWDSLANYSATINVLNRFHDDGGTLIGGLGAEMRAWGDWSLRGEFLLTTVRLANREVVPAGNMTVNLRHPLN